MAKRILKCYYCGEQFDANQVPFVQVNSRRYAHKECAEKAQNEKSQEEKDLALLEEYIKNLFNISQLTPKIRKQISTYHTEKNYSYSGIYKTLKYWFEVRGNSIDKANGGLGIVPYVYDQAFHYWRALWEAQQQNENIKVEEFVSETKEIHIKPPSREPMKHIRKLFTFLEEDENG